MKPYQTAFIELAIRCQALLFGDFTLKSGRRSPYFFNAGRFQSGRDLAELGDCYAAAMKAHGLSCDVLFGPAYKGIPLAAVTAAAAYREYGDDIPYAFNRKEKKAHGEGGMFVGAPVEGELLVVDDVMTAGTAIRELLSLLEGSKASVGAVLIGLDRCERVENGQSATQVFEKDTGIKVKSIINIWDLLEFLRIEGNTQEVTKIEAELQECGV
ncbi:orotate phosphoribosyltransferase [bacterium]|nr:orotate phosphoribosyltransferase [bacterium]